MVLKFFATLALIAGFVSIIVSIVAYFTTGVAAAIYFALVALFNLYLGRWLI